MHCKHVSLHMHRCTYMACIYFFLIYHLFVIIWVRACVAITAAKERAASKSPLGSSIQICFLDLWYTSISRFSLGTVQREMQHQACQMLMLLQTARWKVHLQKRRFLKWAHLETNPQFVCDFLRVFFCVFFLCADCCRACVTHNLYIYIHIQRERERET